MSNTNENIIYGPKQSYEICFKSFGQYLFECLKKRNFEDVIGIDAIENKTLTCGELLERSIKLSRVLKKIPILKEDIAVLLCENTVNNLTPMLALLYLGVPINFANYGYSLDELRHVFKLSKPKLVICVKSALDKVLILKKELHFIETVILFDEPDENYKEVDSIDSVIKNVVADVEHFELADVNLDDTALLCMSSGTTGLPKCTELTHSNFMYAANFTIDKDGYNLSSADITVSVVPVFHVFGQLIYFSSLITSMKIVLIKTFRPDTFLQAIQNYKATKLFMVPSLLHFLATSDKVNNYDISSLKEIFFGGSCISETVLKATEKRLNNVSLRQLYGATELTGACTTSKPLKNTLTIGPLLKNISGKIIDVKSKKLLGACQTGEICIKGMSVMKGYYGNPTETKNSIDNDGFYHTGDVGYYDNNGLLFIVGRIKELIKYKGFQVSPSELEALILNHPGVKDCAVIGINDEIAGELPMACIVTQVGVKVTEEDIIQFVAERISPQKRLHGGVKFLEEIPRNPLGKLLRKELLDRYNKTI